MEHLINKGVKLSPTDMLSNISEEALVRFHVGLERGQLQVELYAPKTEDFQTPHDRDECYVITRGSGQFSMGDQIVDFKAGDFLFVPAGMEHKFSNFGDQMETWVIFYGPIGGDKPQG